MKTVIILIGAGQLEQLMEDLQAGHVSLETKTIALILSKQTVQIHNGAFTFPQGADIYVGPIHTLGFRGSVEEIQNQLDERKAAH